MNPDAPDTTTPTTLPPPAAPARGAAHAHRLDRARMETYFRGVALAVLLLLGAVATLRGYLALEKAILVWLRPQWVPLVQAAFSLAIVAVCVWLIRSWIIARGGD